MKPSLSYGIFRPCRHCVYGKHGEKVLQLTDRRGPRVIVINNTKKAYARHGKCIGFNECGKCFEQIKEHNDDLPCKWVEI